MIEDRKYYIVKVQNKTTPYKLKVPGSTKCFAPGEVMTRMKVRMKKNKTTRK